MKYFFNFILLLSLYNCKTISPININGTYLTTNSKIKLEKWHFKDIIKDSIPGISLERAYQELIKNKKGKEFIIAVIDTEIDIYHKDLRNSIWLNKDEIPNNGIDDDNNGYVDDLNGWNFIGYSKDKSVRYIKYEYVRLIKLYESKFKDLDINQLKNKEKEEYAIYQKALKVYNDELINVKKRIKQGVFLYETYPKSKKALKKIFPKEDYTVKKLDSLYSLIKIKDTTLAKLVFYMKDYKKYKLNDTIISKYRENQNEIFSKTININYNERALIRDNEFDLNDNKYGTNTVFEEVNSYSHGTNVSGVIANILPSSFFKIMPIRINAFGDYHDKDLALSIKYAVDNGAKIINISAGKYFSTFNHWICDAFKYAEKNDVLIVSSAGNQNTNIDIQQYYPIDYKENKNEFVDNFIKVGASSYKLNKNLITNFSNYGKINVDLFAPGEKIYSAYPNNKNHYNSGTSLSTPIVSGIAALVMSYYPKLKASEVKEIILASGVSYDIDVEIKGEDGKKKLVPFKSLSKSGKIVNAYNALLLAKHYKQWKKGKWKM